MTYDSILTPLLLAQSPFQDELPLLPPADIFGPLDDIENASARSQTALVQRALEDFESRGMPLVEAGDAQAIRSLDWSEPLDQQLQVPIVGQTWEPAFNLGGEQGLEAMRGAVLTNQGVVEQVQRLAQIEFTDFNNSAAAEVIRNRAINLAGDFSSDVLERARADLLAGVVAPPGRSRPLTSREVQEALRYTLQVSGDRANKIARTETTNAYNGGRLTSYRQSELVEAVRFIAVGDLRTTEICLSRNGMIILMSDAGSISENQPPLHVRCRSLLSPVMPTVNQEHLDWIQDEARRPSSLALEPLPEGWRGA